MSLILDGTNGESFPSWTTATRPASPSSGSNLGYNSSYGQLEYYNGSSWIQLGALANNVVYENGQTIGTNYTMTTGNNGVSSGPITIATGVTVTIPTGSNWSIV